MRWLARVSVFTVLLSAEFGFSQDMKILRWAMDSSGGAPYVYDNETKGFEVEIAKFLARELGREQKPVNADWDKLPDLLLNGQADIVLNGYELNDQNQKQASIPYYVYHLSLVIPANSTIQSWDDLSKPINGRKPRVGVLTDSAAQRYLEQEYGDRIEMKPLLNVATTFTQVEMGLLDATVQDNPAAIHYVTRLGNTKLRIVPEQRGRGSYVILTHPDNQELRDQINAALRKGLRDGTFENIYRDYGIWDDNQKQELAAETIARLHWPTAISKLLAAAGLTVFLAVVSMPLAILIGLMVAILRLYGPAVLRWVWVAYVEILRGTPLLLQLWVMYYIVPQWIPPLQQLPHLEIWIGIITLAMNYSASEAEHFRGAFLNLPRGQMDAALALGMTPWRAIRVVLAPQAIRAAIPSVTNDFVALFKDTAICSVIAVVELSKQYQTYYSNHREQMFVLAATTAGLYLCMSYPLALLARRLEKKVSEAVK